MLNPSLFEVKITYRPVGWNVDACDWEPGRTPADVDRDVVNGVRANEAHAVVLLHTWPAPTQPALGPIVDGLRGEGATFVTVDQVMDGR